MAKTFTTLVSMEQYMNKACSKAVEKAAQRITDQLQYFIWDDYYALYSPISYDRSFQFLESAISKMVSSNTAEIYMDADSMSYNDYWDGETQINMASAGFHGTADIFRPGFFWKDFISWCDENAINILKEELAKQGINVK